MTGLEGATVGATVGSGVGVDDNSGMIVGEGGVQSVHDASQLLKISGLSQTRRTLLLVAVGCLVIQLQPWLTRRFEFRGPIIKSGLSTQDSCPWTWKGSDASKRVRDCIATNMMRVTLLRKLCCDCFVCFRGMYV